MRWFVRKNYLILGISNGYPDLVGENIFSHIPMHTRSSDPYVSSLSENSILHRY